MELISEGHTEGVPLKVPKLPSSIGSLVELHKEGYTAFSLGPIYVYAGVEMSIPERFAAEQIPGKPAETRGTTFTFGHPIVARCQQWNQVVDIMDNESFDYFVVWMLSLMFVNRQAKNIYVPRRYSAPVLDPFCFARQVGLPTTMHVFTTSSMKSLLRPKCELAAYENAKYFIDFERRDPEVDVIKQGQAILGIVQ